MIFQKHTDLSITLFQPEVYLNNFSVIDKNLDLDLFLMQLNKYLNLPDSDSFVFWLNEYYDSEDPSLDYEYLTSSNFKSFFSNFSIDVPQCFKHSHSLNRDINKLPLLRFTNYLMRDGKRLQTTKFFLQVLWNLQFIEKKTKFNLNTNFSWRSIFNSFHNVTFNKKLLKYPTNFNIKDAFNIDISNYGKHYHTHWNISRLMLLNIKKLEPIFLFYIYKVDKSIYKSTRGKSGKYNFIWKYISPYKRTYLVMHWIMKELKIQPGRTLKDRLNTILSLLYFSPEKTWISKIKRFSYNYVYQNCRKTLAETYVTSTK